MTDRAERKGTQGDTTDIQPVDQNHPATLGDQTEQGENESGFALRDGRKTDRHKQKQKNTKNKNV